MVPTEVTLDRVHQEAEGATTEVAEVTSPEICSDKAQIWEVQHAEVTVAQWATTTKKNEGVFKRKQPTTIHLNSIDYNKLPRQQLTSDTSKTTGAKTSALRSAKRTMRRAVRTHAHRSHLR